ncbi:MAG: AAA family ATPase, partial [Chloroflexi bacterium]|nr:AAA family ATPase [Chloroflexota bacterium]
MTAEHKISDSERDLDPNVRQRHASDPERSVWVGASAGTGKTKVLTDRVLRLLLPRPDGREGTAPFRILCLTFTKAAASEMLQRINDTLSKWATIPEEELRKKLQDLSGKNPSQEDIQAARRLFAAVVDTPGGLKVMTIHSFCQSILGRFPIEAGLSPHFSVIDESQSAELIGRARDLALEKARQNEDSPLGLAVRHIAAWQNEDQFGNLLRSLCSERKQLDTLGDNPDELHKKLCALFEIAPTDTTATIISAACEETTFDKDGLYAVCRALAQGTKTDIERGHNIQLWLDAPQAERAQQIENYMTQFLTKKYEPRTKLAGKDAVSAAPEIEQILAQERDRMVALHDLRKAVQCAALTRDLFLLGQEIVSAYQRFKEERALLDYDDLILSTLDLLEKKDIAPWVMFKLDGGLDHILVDEAQDTNPEQWNVILKLTEEFFSGAGSRDDVTRTSFTVGDEKQSIYSFQRASPAEFARIRELFVGDGKADEENLNISFRTVKTVLALVDKVFRPDHVRKGLGRDAVEHISFRKGQAGLCEIWEIFKPDDKQEDELWSPPITTSEMRSGAAKLADYIGDKIKGWLDNGEQIESRGRTVQPGDIMILMRTRTAFVGQLVRALKTRNIPVSGVDRMVLGEQIAVMDLLALAQFALLPDDDLTLACVLKSPLIGLNEDQLYDLAIDRKGSLWSALRDSNHKEVTTYLHKLISDAAADHPYEFFNRILQRPCPADSVSGLRALRKRLGDDALDPLDEFLSAALSYEHDHIPTLQGFLLWQQQGDITIKRELEEAGQAVRIMTVHGAKGLQAPIVIMPDTTRTGSSRKIDNLLWPD